MNGPIVIASAIYDKSGFVFHVDPPGRHEDVIRHMLKIGKLTPSCGIRGFLLSDGKFVSREEARVVAASAGQLLPVTRELLRLFSRDLW